MRRHLAGLVACVALLAGCQAVMPTVIAPTPVGLPPTVLPSPGTIVSTPNVITPLGGGTPTLVAPRPPTTNARTSSSVDTDVAIGSPTTRPTSAPKAVPTLAPTATPAEPRPTLTATQVAQQHFCDNASPPARLPLPLLGPYVHITPAEAVTQPTSSPGGPQKLTTDAPPRVSAPHVAVIDEASGNLLYAQDAFSRQPPASITKIVTTIVALERGPDIQTVFRTSVSATAMVTCDGSSVMGLEPDDHVKLETLLYGMMLPSGNDAAEQVAVSLAGTREHYVAWMNEKVASLHLRDTHFVTPSGMDSDEQYSSVYDMALIGRYAMQNPEFRTLAATPRFVGDDYYMHNLNPLLGSYAGADGVKIGYTEIAGRTIVASATRDGHRVYVSLMGSRSLAGDCIALFDWVWKSFRW
jgi:D-alanyl-D-alanine carboxypeptidase